MADTTLHTNAGPARRRVRIGLFSRLRAWRAMRHQRLALSRLDAHRLNDLGLTEADVARELTRPFWDAPAHWFD